MSVPTISLRDVKKQTRIRTRGWLPLSEWGPVCAGCGGDEFRLDGYCSLECRDYHSDEDMEVVLALVGALEAAAEGMPAHAAACRCRVCLAFERFSFDGTEAGNE